MMDRNLSDPKDVELEASVSRAVRHMGAGLHVKARNGRVTLSGMVEDFSTKRDIVSTVRGMAGVHEVTNYLKIAPVND